MRTTRLCSYPVLILVLAVLTLALPACDAVIVQETNEPPTADIIFTASDAVMALATDGEENVYAVTIEGSVFKISPEGKSEELLSGLKTCGFSLPNIATLPNGDVLVNDCVDKNDTLVRIDPAGNTSTLIQLEEPLRSMTADASGKIYLGFWLSEGNITIGSGRLEWAHEMWGQIATLDQAGTLTIVYEGGIPFSVAASNDGALYAALWGQKGRFKPEDKDYHICGPKNHFWIFLSDQVDVQQLDSHSITSELNGVSYVAAGKPGFILAFGEAKGGECGIYQLESGRAPRRLTVAEDDVDENITALAVSDHYMFFADKDGNVYKVKLKNLVTVKEVAERPAEPSRTPVFTQPPFTETAQPPIHTPTPAAKTQPPTNTPTPTTAQLYVETAKPPTATPAPPSLPAALWQPVLDLPRYINALVVDPTNSQILYAATGNYAGSGSGVYKSEDAGLTWRSVTAGLPNEEVLALAFSSSAPPLLYALVGGDIFANANGASWSRLGDTGFFGGHEHLLRADPSDGNVLFALSKSDSLVRSGDGGYAWQPISAGLPDGGHGKVSVLSLAIDPTDTNLVYAGTGAFVGGGQGVYKSIDGGETWSPANRGMLDYRITAVAVDPTRPQTVYAGADDGTFFKSTDGGQSWNDLTDMLPVQSNSRPTIRDIVIDPGAVYLLADNAGVLISDDGGARWRALGNPAAPDYTSFTAMTIILDLQPELVLFIGIKDSGCWRYDVAQPAALPTATEPLPVSVTALPLPSGRWRPIADLPRGINALIADPTDPQVFYASTGDLGSGGSVYKSTDGGQTWGAASPGSSTEAVLALAFSHNTPPMLYAAAGVSGEIFASVDGVKNWTRLGNSGLWGGFYRQLYTAPSDPSVLFTLARPGGVARSGDGGYTWMPFGAGLPQGETGEAAALSLAIDPTDANVIYVGTGGWVGQGHGVYKSIDGGETWSAANKGMLDYRISALAIDPTDPQTLYAGGDSGELFKSSDGGQNWQDLSENIRIHKYLNARTIRNIVIDPTTAETVYLLGDVVGVMVSNDGGRMWRALAKPGQDDQPVFLTLAVVWEPEAVFIVAIEDGGGWRYAEE